MKKFDCYNVESLLSPFDTTSGTRKIKIYQICRYIRYRSTITSFLTRNHACYHACTIVTPVTCLRVIHLKRVVAFQVSWYYTWRGISRTQILWYYTWHCPSRNPVACKSMVTRQIFKSHTLTFVCDTCKLTCVCEVIVELYCIIILANFCL